MKLIHFEEESVLIQYLYKAYENGKSNCSRDFAQKNA